MPLKTNKQSTSDRRPKLPHALPVLPRLACRTARVLPRGWSRLTRLAAGYWPSLREVYVDIDIFGPMCLDLSESVCSALLKYGYYPHQLAEDTIISTIVKPNMIVFDLGANIGWYSCLMHHLIDGRGMVVAVEPMPRALRLLRKSASSRPLLHVVPSAIGEQSGFARLREEKLLDTSQVSYATTGDVEVVTIDGLASRFGHPDVIKIDIEGAELMALRGAGRTLSNTRPPIILFEYIRENVAAFGGYQLRHLVELLEPQDYRVFQLSHEATLHSLEASQQRKLTNDYLAVPKGRLGEIRPFCPVGAA